MVTKSKINLARVLACQDMVCSKCGYHIPPSEILRLDFERVKCPACGETFVPTPKAVVR